MRILSPIRVKKHLQSFEWEIRMWTLFSPRISHLRFGKNKNCLSVLDADSVDLNGANPHLKRSFHHVTIPLYFPRSWFCQEKNPKHTHTVHMHRTTLCGPGLRQCSDNTVFACIYYSQSGYLLIRLPYIHFSEWKQSFCPKLCYLYYFYFVLSHYRKTD